MAEQSEGSFVTDDPALHGEQIAARITSLMDYGPLRVQTYVTGIPGIEYRQPYRNELDQRLVAHIGGSALSVLVDESGIRIAVQTKITDTPFLLAPEQIDDVRIDHPHGHYMPLNGRDMMAVSLTKREGVSVLRWPDHVIEYGWYDRIETTTQPTYPGVSIVRAFRADDENIMNTGERRIPSLDEAKEKDDQPRTFYMTKIDVDTYVVTSRMGYEETTPVTVRRPKHPGDEPLLHVEMVDMAKGTSDDDLLENHLRRYRQVSQKSFESQRLPMTPIEADGLFLYMVSD